VDLFGDFEGGEGEHESDERWVISYADFITTLFALFVLLFALSLKETRLEEGIESVARMIGARPLIGGLRPGQAQGVSGARRQPARANLRAPQTGADPLKSPEESLNSSALPRVFVAELKALKERIERDLSRYGNSGVSLRLTPDGLVISLAAARFFKSGEAEIQVEQEPVLAAVTADIANLENQMRVEGFTDPIPIHNSRFTDNWDLSAERAGNVLRYLLTHSSLDPNQLSIAGYGPYRPIASNETEEGRALNRRVDILIKPDRQTER
jgi:chemotaxis protein MotB